MNDNIKSSVGLFVPTSSLVVFVYFCLLENFLAAILAAVGGVVFWYLYSVIMESKMPDITGNVVIFLAVYWPLPFFSIMVYQKICLAGLMSASKEQRLLQLFFFSLFSLGLA